MLSVSKEGLSTGKYGSDTFDEFQMIADLLEDCKGWENEADRALDPPCASIWLVPFATLRLS